MAASVDSQRNWWSDDDAEMGHFLITSDLLDSDSDSEMLEVVRQLELAQNPVNDELSHSDDSVGLGNSNGYADVTTDPLARNETLSEGAGTSTDRRFPVLNHGDLESLETSMNSKGTIRQTKWGVGLFRQWLGENEYNVNFEIMSESTLADCLRRFYASARNASGSLYSKSTFVGIRASINRHIRGAPYHRSLSILNGDAFHQANSMFKAMLKKLKREGMDTTKHHDPITEADFLKLQSSGVFSTDNPIGLQRKVWFDVTLNFARRGRENLRDLKSDAFLFKSDESGYQYVEMRYNEATKNHQGDNLKDRDFESKPRMYASGNAASCPVTSLAKYLAKRNQSNDIFFQKAKTQSVTESDAVWYTTRPLGEKTLNNLMKVISSEASLSKSYTNHCVKATTVTRLAHAGVEAREIMRISGHRNEQSIRSYNTDSSEVQKRQYSAILQGEAENGGIQVPIPVRREPLSVHFNNTVQNTNTNVMTNSLPSTSMMFSKQFEIHNSNISVHNYFN